MNVINLLKFLAPTFFLLSLAFLAPKVSALSCQNIGKGTVVPNMPRAVTLYQDDDLSHPGWTYTVVGRLYQELPSHLWNGPNSGVSGVWVPRGFWVKIYDELGGGGHCAQLFEGWHDLEKINRPTLSWEAGPNSACKNGLTWCWSDHVVAVWDPDETGEFHPEASASHNQIPGGCVSNSPVGIGTRLAKMGIAGWNVGEAAWVPAGWPWGFNWGTVYSCNPDGSGKWVPFQPSEDWKSKLVV